MNEWKNSSMLGKKICNLKLPIFTDGRRKANKLIVRLYNLWHKLSGQISEYDIEYLYQDIMDSTPGPHQHSVLSEELVDHKCSDYSMKDNP